MRLIVGIMCLLLGLGTLSCQWEGKAAEQAADAQASRWVRTADGWERPDSWQVSIRQQPSLHPLVLAAGQGMVSLFALTAWTGNSQRKRNRLAM